MVEFAAVFMMFLTVVMGTIDIGILLGLHNMAAKAVQVGARHAVQSDAATTAIGTFNAIDSISGMVTGEALTYDRLGRFTVTCTTAGCGCTGDGCGSLGNLKLDATAMQAIVNMVRPLGPYSATDADVFVEYTHVGQGFAGRPGSDITPLVTVGISPVTHNYLFLSALGIPAHTFPTFRATLPAEDLSSSAPS